MLPPLFLCFSVPLMYHCALLSCFLFALLLLWIYVLRWFFISQKFSFFEGSIYLYKWCKELKKTIYSVIFFFVPEWRSLGLPFLLYSFLLHPCSSLLPSTSLLQPSSSFPKTAPPVPQSPPRRPHCVCVFLLTAVQNVSEEVVKVHNDCICLL